LLELPEPGDSLTARGISVRQNFLASHKGWVLPSLVFFFRGETHEFSTGIAIALFGVRLEVGENVTGEFRRREIRDPKEIRRPKTEGSVPAFKFTPRAQQLAACSRGGRSAVSGGFRIGHEQIAARRLVMDPGRKFK
jgi:hypothetical protein